MTFGVPDETCRSLIPGAMRKLLVRASQHARELDGTEGMRSSCTAYIANGRGSPFRLRFCSALQFQETEIHHRLRAAQFEWSPPPVVPLALSDVLPEPAEK